MIQSVKSNSTFSPSFSTFNFSINYACTYQSLLFIRSQKIPFETDVFVDLFYNLLYKRLLGSWGLQITQNKTSLPNVLGHGRQPGLARSNSWSSYLYLIPIFIVCYAKPCRIVPSHKMLSTPT